MHRSRVFGLIIDTPTAGVAESVAFWSAALGSATSASPEWDHFTSLTGAIPGLTTAIQAVDDSARYHLDIETDDVEAEVARLCGLGATEISRWLDCHVLRAPSGHLLCVIPVHTAPEFFAEHAQTWPAVAQP